MRRKEMSQTKGYKDYYTAAEVKDLLGITDGQLYNYVRYGHLERVIPPGRKQGVYKRAEVDKFALEMKAFLASNREAKRFTFTKVTEDDVAENVRLTRAAFNSDAATIEGRSAWIKKNPNVSYQLCLDGAVIGCVTMLPLSLERIEQILRDEVSSENTQPEAIEEYRPSKLYHIYVMGACVSPSLTKQEKRWYGAKLVRGLLEALVDLGKQGIEIETITGRSVTVDGVRLMRHLGFTQIPSITHNTNFRLYMKEATQPFVEEYRQALNDAKKRLNEQHSKVKARRK
jgi:hypothetical protein